MSADDHYLTCSWAATDVGSDSCSGNDSSMDISISGIEKFPNNMEKSTQMIKENLDKKFGAPWHVVLGEGFAYDIQFESKHCLNLFIGGTKAILVWKK